MNELRARKESLLVGILGGMGPSATVDFYSKLVRSTPANRDQDHLRIIMWADPTVPDRSQALLSDGDDPTPWLLAGALKLRACGAQLLAVPCNTAHAFLGPVTEACGIPLVSMIDSAVSSLSSQDYRHKRVGLLATTGTVRSGLYRHALAEIGIDCVAPIKAEQLKVTAAIEAVKAGRISENIVADLNSVASALIARGADSLLAACSEIVLAMPNGPGGVRLIDPSLEMALRVVQLASGAAADERRPVQRVSPV